jgi:hypothetical protein
MQQSAWRAVLAFPGLLAQGSGHEMPPGLARASVGPGSGVHFGNYIGTKRRNRL